VLLLRLAASGACVYPQVACPPVDTLGGQLLLSLIFSRSQCTPRENPGYRVWEKGPALRWDGAQEWLIRPWKACVSTYMANWIHTGLYKRRSFGSWPRATEQLVQLACRRGLVVVAAGQYAHQHHPASPSRSSSTRSSCLDQRPRCSPSPRTLRESSPRYHHHQPWADRTIESRRRRAGSGSDLGT